jgi:hypothetical protein
MSVQCFKLVATVSDKSCHVYILQVYLQKYSVGRIVTRVYVRHTMLVRIMSGMFRTGH